MFLDRWVVLGFQKKIIIYDYIFKKKILSVLNSRFIRRGLFVFSPKSHYIKMHSISQNKLFNYDISTKDLNEMLPKI